jgi:hypothetical protein
METTGLIMNTVRQIESSKVPEMIFTDRTRPINVDLTRPTSDPHRHPHTTMVSTYVSHDLTHPLGIRSRVGSCVQSRGRVTATTNRTRCPSLIPASNLCSATDRDLGFSTGCVQSPCEQCQVTTPRHLFFF